MNSNWRNRPTSIDSVSRNMNYVISVDESGNANLNHIIKARQNERSIVDSEKHFTVTACSIAIEDFKIAEDMVMAVKHKYWPDALFDYQGIKKRVCFHSREIRGKREAFNPELINYDEFMQDISSMMAEIPITLYASHIDKEAHIDRYKNPVSPYNLCMTFVLERIVKSIPQGSTCIVILEARGKNEDRNLLAHIKSLLDNGTEYCSPNSFSKIKGVYFNPKWCKLVGEKKSYWELELADLCAYPIHKKYTYGTQDKAFETIIPKIYGYPDHLNRGLKVFP